MLLLRANVLAKGHSGVRVRVCGVADRDAEPPRSSRRSFARAQSARAVIWPRWRTWRWR